jgi:hypothetical protein
MQKPHRKGGDNTHGRGIGALGQTKPRKMAGEKAAENVPGQELDITRLEPLRSEGTPLRGVSTPDCLGFWGGKGEDPPDLVGDGFGSDDDIADPGLTIRDSGTSR